MSIKVLVCLLVKILKFGNIRFVGNLIGDIHWNFYDDDFIIVTSAYRFVRQKKKTFSETCIFCSTSHFQCFNNLGSNWECTSNVNLFRLESVSQRQLGPSKYVIRPFISCRNNMIFADFNNLKQNYIILCFNFFHFFNYYPFYLFFFLCELGESPPAYAYCISAVYAVTRWLSVRPSCSWVAPKRIKISSKFFHRRVAKPF